MASVGSYSHRLGSGRVISFLIALLGEGSPSGAERITPPGSGGVPYKQRMSAVLRMQQRKFVHNGNPVGRGNGHRYHDHGQVLVKITRVRNFSWAG